MAHEQRPGFMGKIKEMLPGHHRKPDFSGETEETVPRVSEGAISPRSHTNAMTPREEKKSMLHKIKDKLSGHHDKENSGPDVAETPGRHSDVDAVKETKIDDNNASDYRPRRAGAKPGMARNNSF